MLSVKQGGISIIFWVFGMTQPGIEPLSPGPLGNTLLIRPINSRKPPNGGGSFALSEILTLSVLLPLNDWLANRFFF